MRHRVLTLSTLGCSILFAAIAAGTGACSVDDPGSQLGTPNAGAGGTAAGTAGTGPGAAGGGAAGVATGGSTSGGFATGGMTSAGAGGARGGGGSGGAAGGGSGGAAGGSGGSGPGKTPMCLTPDVMGGVDRSDNNYVECDVEDQAIDFDIATAYKPPRKPGYDPMTTPVTFTDFGTALTGFAVQECHPYCYRGNLTLGLDLIAGSEKSLQGEVLFGFPPTVAPIVDPKGRASLGWVYVDGPALPAGTTLTLTMVLKSTDKGIVIAKDNKTMALKKWAEFRYFPIDQGFAATDLVNITHIGFRVTLTPAASAQDWHGVIYADHFQLRK
jgi:hypothetical protein